MGGYMQPQDRANGHELVDFGLNPQSALDAPRWQWLGGMKVGIEQGASRDLASVGASRRKVQIASDLTDYGRGQIILRDPVTGVLCGGTGRGRIRISRFGRDGRRSSGQEHTLFHKDLPGSNRWQNLPDLTVLETTMLRVFERRLDPFPPDELPPPPNGLARFLWACTRGARGYILALALLSAAVSVYEAWLFSFLSQVVDLLSTWQAGGKRLLGASRVVGHGHRHGAQCRAGGVAHHGAAPDSGD
jgi:hypothetical protein